MYDLWPEPHSFDILDYSYYWYCLRQSWLKMDVIRFTDKSNVDLGFVGVATYLSCIVDNVFALSGSLKNDVTLTLIGLCFKIKNSQPFPLWQKINASCSRFILFLRKHSFQLYILYLLWHANSGKHYKGAPLLSTK